MSNNGWVIVIFENEHANFSGEVAYVKGPFEQYEQAVDWANSDEDCDDGKYQITFIENLEVKRAARRAVAKGSNRL